MKRLFQKFQLGKQICKNRVVCLPMVTSKYREDGYVSSENIEHYTKIAKGGVGLIIQEATCVSKTGKLSFQQLGIWEDNQIPGLKKIATAVHREHVPIIIQIHHGGIMSVTGNLCPSNLTCKNPFSGKALQGKEMSSEDIETVIHQFVSSGERAYKAGYDGIELHGAHGYLISQFLNTNVNKRLDKYGTDPTLFVLRIIKGIRLVTSSDFIIGIRLGAFEPTLEATINTAKKLEPYINYLNISAGFFGMFTPCKPVGYPYMEHIYASEKIKAAINVPVFVANFITNPQMADDILVRTNADMVGIGRGLLINPNWVKDAESGANTGTCLQCKNCFWLPGNDRSKCPGKKIFAQNQSSVTH
ncbi:MAG: NADH:flavin oxidoreductase [Acidaminococcaceae bacterium]|jgi:2,4-dienoyl-CoA reductase-like NADH-dependent reductase (Old Yellow Enzyme family)|nr:NADH:flavin oxidoreductase [Acidaminococcaceae bacterium]